MHEIGKKSGVLIRCAIGFEMQTRDAKAPENLESGSTNRFLLASMNSSKRFATFLKRKAARKLYAQCLKTMKKSHIYVSHNRLESTGIEFAR